MINKHNNRPSLFLILLPAEERNQTQAVFQLLTSTEMKWFSSNYADALLHGLWDSTDVCAGIGRWQWVSSAATAASRWVCEQSAQCPLL